MEELQEMLQKAINKSMNKTINNIDKPIYEFVATYDAGTLTRYINH
jgi:hypothetical protein